jgi:hypothetical protein
MQNNISTKNKKMNGKKKAVIYSPVCHICGAAVNLSRFVRLGSVYHVCQKCKGGA